MKGNNPINKTKINLDSLIQCIEYHGKLTKQELKALEQYENDLVFKKVLERIQIVDESQKGILFQVIGENLGLFVSD